jgi:hypothetical protein
VLCQLTRQDEPDTVDKLARARRVVMCRNTYEVWISRDEMVDFLL